MGATRRRGARLLALAAAGSRLYAGLAVVLVNAALLVVAVDVLAAVGLRLAHVPPPRPGTIVSPLDHLALLRAVRAMAGPGSDRSPVLALADGELARIYPGWRREDVRALLRETHGRPLRFDGVTQFREAPYRGRFVNVSPAGFRQGGAPAPWPPPASAYVIWVLGGSTTFGYGLPDAETLPAQLERLLRQRHPGIDVRVYNFGQAYYYSVQELALLEELLRAAPPPRRAVFVDGINEHFARPFYSRWLAQLLGSPLLGWLHRSGADSLDGDASVARWRRDKRLAEGVCAAFAAKPLFVWQPTPDWGYDLRYHLLWQPRARGPRPVYGENARYAALDALLHREPAALGSDFLWLGDLQRDARAPLYVDRLHYSARFTATIAERIATALERQP